MPSPNTSAQPESFPAANAETQVRVTAADLPLHCPGPKAALWASHPRVYIPLGENGADRYVCPYCGTEYILTESS